MKTNLRSLASVLVASNTLWFGILPGRAQDTTISAAEFQRMVYSAHLLTQLDEKPELDASLQVLLELQRRNPNADPAALAEVLRQTLARYRTNAPLYIRTSGYRDEVLAAYLESLRQIPARTNFVQANLSLLNGFMLDPNENTNSTTSELFHSANQRLLNSENQGRQRQALVDSCASRAQGNASFAAALDGLLVPGETLVSVTSTPAEIIGNPNSALNGNYTMQTLLGLASGDGSLTISSNSIMALYASERQTLWDTINTNLALEVEFNQNHPDLLAYLGDPNAVNAQNQLETAVRQGQPRTIASASAAIFVQSKLLDAPAPRLFKMPKEVRAVGGILANFSSAYAQKDPGAAIEGAFGVFDLVNGTESPEDENVRELGNIKSLIQDLSTNINYRFDRVDQSLTTIFDTLNEQFGLIEITLGAQSQQIATLNGNVNEIRHTLVQVQMDLHRLERQLYESFNALARQNVVAAMEAGLFYEAGNPGPMTWAEYGIGTLSYENTFYNYAVNFADDYSASPNGFSSGDLADSALFQALAGARPLDANLNYVKEFLSSRLSQNTGGTSPLANPRDWFTSAYAYLQLGVENPNHYRTKPDGAAQVQRIMNKGLALANFFRSLTFTNSTSNSFNWPLYGALTDYYNGKLNNFSNEVKATEQQFGSLNGFDVETWRQWSASAPRIASPTTGVFETPDSLGGSVQEAYPTAVSAGFSHNLAVRTDGSVVGWGFNNYGQITIPANLSNAVAVAASRLGNNSFSLALKADGKVIGWGNNTYGPLNIPGNLTNVVAIAAGGYHGLALQSNGVVVVWGNNDYGQLTKPAGLSNVVAIAAGWGHNLALKSDGSVIGWGYNGHGEATGVPTLVGPTYASSGPVTLNGQPLTGVTNIAAGDYHSLAIKSDGSVVGWGYNDQKQITIPIGLTNVKQIAGGLFHSVALKTDGSVVAWGDNGSGQTNKSAALSKVKQIVAGGNHNLALRADGTVFNWGDTGQGQINTLTLPAAVGIGAGNSQILVLSPYGYPQVWPFILNSLWNYPYSAATNIVAVSAGNLHNLALRGDGTVLAWGENTLGQTNVPAGLGSVVGVAAGGAHNLALKSNGTVAGWGLGTNIANPHDAVRYGQAAPPVAASNVMAVVAGNYHSLALRADGTVVGWGRNIDGQATGVKNLVSPFASSGVVTVSGGTLTNVTAIAAGSDFSLALKENGTVIGWGKSNSGQTNIPAGLNGVRAIAAGSFHSLALKNDGTVVGWGRNVEGQATGLANVSSGLVMLQGRTLSNVVAIAASVNQSLALLANGDTVAWGQNDYHPAPRGLSDAVAIAARDQHAMALRSDGTVIEWGNEDGLAPTGLANVVAIATGWRHSLALKADGTVVGWGFNQSGQTNIPAGLSSVAGIAAGANHNLALKTNGTVVAWGNNELGQTNTPAGLNNIVSVAVGDFHSLALKGDGTVVAWGNNTLGETNVPGGLASVVAIAAGNGQNLALKANGTVVGWGSNNGGQATGVPGGPAGLVSVQGQPLTNVVALAAGNGHSLALRADGTAVGWGDNSIGQIDNVYFELQSNKAVALAAGANYSLYLTTPNPALGSPVPSAGLSRAQIPARVGSLLSGADEELINELNSAGSLKTSGEQLDGAKALFQAVLELGMPYTLERDEVLHGFLYGSESLVDQTIAQDTLAADSASLQANPSARPQLLSQVADLRYLRFAQRLSERLLDVQATGQPEIPRLVGHTLRLLDLLRDSWSSTPSSSLEIGSKTNGLGLVLYGEPYARYTLLQSSNLNNWTSTSITNLRSADSPIGTTSTVQPITGAPQRYYRVAQPVP